MTTLGFSAPPPPFKDYTFTVVVKVQAMSAVEAQRRLDAVLHQASAIEGLVSLIDVRGLELP